MINSIRCIFMLPYSNIQHIDSGHETWNTEQWENSVMRHHSHVLLHLDEFPEKVKGCLLSTIPVASCKAWWCCWQQASSGVVVALHDCVKTTEYGDNLPPGPPRGANSFLFWCSHIPRWQCHHELMHTNSLVSRLNAAWISWILKSRMWSFHLPSPSNNWRLPFLKSGSVSCQTWFRMQHDRNKDLSCEGKNSPTPYDCLDVGISVGGSVILSKPSSLNMVI